MFISIITVVYNGEKTIGRTIKSILEQKFSDFEYIIQDGGSTDGTKLIVDSMTSELKGKLHWYSERDNGIYDAMNKAISHAKGQYIWLVNADDYITSNALQEFYEYCEHNNFPRAVISGRMNVVDAITNKLYVTTPASNEIVFRKSCSKLKMGICHPATIVHRDVYENICTYDDRYFISADLDFAIRCYRESATVIFTDLVMTNMTDGGISNRLPIKKCMHDCNLRAKKFCPNVFMRIAFKIWYFLRLLIIKFRGYKYN